MPALRVPGVRIRRLLPFAVGGLVVLLVAGIIVTRIVKDDYVTGLRERLARDAMMLDGALPHVPALADTSIQWTQLAGRWHETLEARVQFFDSAGSLLADSDGPLDGAGGTARDELEAAVRQDLQQGTESQVRGDVVYAARYLRRDGRVAGAVQLSVPIGRLDSSHRQFRWLLFWLFGLALVVIAAISILSLIPATRALTKLAEGAARFSQEDWDARVPVDPYRRADEFTAVAHAFNRMAAEVKFRFEQQRQQREQLEAVVGNMNDGLLAVDASGVVRLVNQTFVRYFRSAFEDPVGRTHTEAFREQGLNEMIEKTLSGASGEEGELEVLAPARRVLVVRMALIPNARKNEVRAVLLARDVTARRRLQELRRDFVANVSHELRTPLTAVIGYIEALRDTVPLTPEGTGFLDTIARNAERMERIVGDLLELSRIEAPGFALQLAPFSLSELAGEVDENFKGLITQKNQTLSVAIPESLGKVIADREAVARILTNLVENAHKYTPTGGHISIEAERAGSDVILAVCDDGIGVPEADRPRLFERFFRVDRARSRDAGGTGLGLAIVKHLAEAHGGSAHYEVRIPAGSRLVVRLPQEGSAAPPPEPPTRVKY